MFLYYFICFFEFEVCFNHSLLKSNYLDYFFNCHFIDSDLSFFLVLCLIYILTDQASLLTAKFFDSIYLFDLNLNRVINYELVPFLQENLNSDVAFLCLERLLCLSNHMIFLICLGLLQSHSFLNMFFIYLAQESLKAVYL